MEAATARLVLDLGSGRMELEGTEEFVVSQFVRAADLLAADPFRARSVSPTAGEAQGPSGEGLAPRQVAAARSFDSSSPAVDDRPQNPGAETGRLDEGASEVSEVPRELPESFDVWLERLRGGRPKAKDVERVLWAGYHIQLRSMDGSFTASQVTALLKQHGISVKYPSQAVHQNWRTGKVTRVGRGRFRLTPEGIARITKRLAA